MARYQCLICGEDKTFTQYAHCERHLTAAHSGFGFKCDHCGALLGRVDQTHKNCGEYHLDLIKRSTMTCTPEERKEFEEFQNNRYKHIKQIMKGLPIPMSDQPFGTINRPSQAKKTKLVEAHTERPRKKAKRVETISKAPEATLTERREEEGRKENREMETKKQAEEKEEKVQVKEQSSSARCRGYQDSESDSDTDSSSSSSESSDSDSDSESESDEENVPSIGNSPKITIASSSADTRTVTAENQEQPTNTGMTVTAETVSVHTNVDDIHCELERMATQQSKRIVLNVGGKRFETSVPTLQREPNSVLARMVERDAPIKPYNTDNIYTYFIDRNPAIFSLIMEYLRLDKSHFERILPKDMKTLILLHAEATFFRMQGLVGIVENKPLEIMFK